MPKDVVASTELSCDDKTDTGYNAVSLMLLKVYR